MRELTVLYDASCAMCVRCRAWLEEQRALVPMRFLPCASDEARARYGLVPWLGEELVVVSDEGDVWAGPAAFLVCLWALEEWREWSYTLSESALSPLATRFFQALSSRRRAIAAFLTPDPCEEGTCKAPSSHRPVVAYR
jgi:predicted DCC family thiol-disulfide oxidoreductase YuxK